MPKLIGIECTRCRAMFYTTKRRRNPICIRCYQKQLAVAERKENLTGATATVNKEDGFMGMFEKDKEYGLRLDQSFEIGEPFIVWGATIKDETIATSIGDAEVANITASPISDPGDKLEYNSVASAIVEKVKLAEPSDFPAVCELRRVKSKKWGTENILVLQFIKEYK